VRLVVLVCGLYEGVEEWMRFEGLGLELRVELAAEEVGMVRNLDDLDVGGVRGGAADAESRAGEDGLVLAVKFVTVAVTFADFGFAVGIGGE